MVGGCGLARVELLLQRSDLGPSLGEPLAPLLVGLGAQSRQVGLGRRPPLALTLQPPLELGDGQPTRFSPALGPHGVGLLLCVAHAASDSMDVPTSRAI